MNTWVELPDNPGKFPKVGEIVHFKRGGELSEPLIVREVDYFAKIVHFTGSIPHDVCAGDELIGYIPAKFA